MTRALWWSISAIIIIGLIAAYVNTLRMQGAENTQVTETEQTAGIANPASTNCINLGGTLEIVEGANGQYGLCHMNDGRVCEEWSLFRDGSCVVPTQ